MTRPANRPPGTSAELETASGRSRLTPALIGCIGLAALAASLWAGMSFLLLTKPRPYHVQMAADVTPLRTFLAERLSQEAVRHNLHITLSSTHYGALEALATVESSETTKLALVPGGITAQNYPAARLVTTLTHEPLHLLVRGELAAKGFSALRGKRIDLGPPSTASYHVSREVLAFVGLTPATKSEARDDEFLLESTPPDELYDNLGRIDSLAGPVRLRAVDKLPDAVMFFAGLPSHLAKRLVTAFGYRLIPVSFAEAFCLDRLNPPGADGVHVDRSLLTATEIPAYVYQSDPPVPTKALPTIAAPLLLIAQDRTDPEIVIRLLEIIYDTHLPNVLRPPPLRDQVHPFPPHPGTERYLHRNDPLVTPESVAKLGTLVGGCGAFASGLISFYTILRLRKFHRFEAYYRELSRIERIACGLETDPTLPDDRALLRERLETRLSDLKCRVLQDFADGGLKGESFMAGVITLISDARESLSRALPDPADKSEAGRVLTGEPGNDR